VIAAVDERAEALRLKPGMGVADARAMHPSVEIVEAEPEADRRLLEGLAAWCDRYTPLVALEGAEGLFLDITGCAHLFGGERRMLKEISTRFFDQGFRIRAALASTPGAAWAAARFHDCVIVAAGDEGEMLAQLPLSALRIEAGTQASLESVGLRTVGSVMGTPRGPLARRFGTLLLERLDQALGRVEEAVSPRLPIPPLSVERRLAEPIASTDDIEALVTMLAAALKNELEARDEGARTLRLHLFRVDGAVGHITVGASRPLRRPDRIRKLFKERLTALAGDIDAGYGFDLVRLSALATAPFEAEQADLSGDVSVDTTEDIAMLADRVRARLGERAFLQPLLQESHLPEEACRSVPYAEILPPSRPAAVEERLPENFAPGGRPIRLFENPEPVDVMAVEVPEGPPRQFRWRRALHRVARAEGPERIAPEWWRSTERVPARDYFRVEDDAGRRYWLYREGLYGTAGKVPRWFMQGFFA
jgi:protein ImuB